MPASFTARRRQTALPGESGLAHALLSFACMGCQHLEVVDNASHAVGPDTVRRAAPDAQVAEARQLVASWLQTSFIARGDAVEDLVERIACCLAEHDARANDPR
jgi:hypothetical protein